MSAGALLANLGWLLATLPRAIAFRLATLDPMRAQRRALMRIVKRDADCEMGRAIGLARVRSPEDFARRVPLSSYESYREPVRRIAAGEQGVLTRDHVLLLEQSGATTGGAKLIPYTASLSREFSRGIDPWIADLFLHDVRLMSGRAYWSITPVGLADSIEAGPHDRDGRDREGPAVFEDEKAVRMGFADDSEYLGRLAGRFARAARAVPSEVRELDDPQTSKYVTLLFLLAARDLRLISIWNPMFLISLVEPLAAWRRALVEDLRAGAIRPPGRPREAGPWPDQARVLESLSARLRPDRRRAEEVQAAFEEWEAAHVTPPSEGQERLAGSLHARLWPRLRLISCWGDANAARCVPRLKALFPQVAVQPKGLIATEGFVSMPLFAAPDPVLAIRSHFFEFIPLAVEEGFPPGEAREAQGRPRPVTLDRLEAGRSYSVVLTTGGGLCRYRLQDVVEVTGWHRSCPTLRFLGKEPQVSDRFGEKLEESHVMVALDRAFERRGLAPAFAMMACEQVKEPTGSGRPVSGPTHAYTLFLEVGAQEERLSGLADEIEEILCENFHYEYCRRLDQLGHARVVAVGRGSSHAYLTECVRRGQREGDVKPVGLHPGSGWTEVFA
jgi:hypothetical protein